MQHRKLSTTLAILATGVGLSAFASSAQAVVVDNDGASLTNNAEVQLTDANLAWDFSSGTIEPRVTGTMEVVNGDDACFRVRIDSYDGNTLLHSKRGTNRCMLNDLPHQFDINLAEDADPLTDTVVVKVEKDGAQGWTVRDEREIHMNTFSDDVILEGSGIDAGGPSYYAGTPLDSAYVRWAIDDGLVTATYDGYVHFDGFSRCGRIRARLLDEAGALVEAINGPQHCPPDLAHYEFNDVLAGTPSGLVTDVQLLLQSKTGGNWNTVESETVSIAE
jgi:hypothetical protein